MSSFNVLDLNRTCVNGSFKMFLKIQFVSTFTMLMLLLKTKTSEEFKQTFDEKFGKNKKKNACLLKLSILLQFRDEILALLCSDDPSNFAFVLNG